MQPAPSHSTPVESKPTLDNCDAVMIQFAPPEALTFVVVWRDRPRYVHPLERGKRIRDLQRGDRVTYRGKTYAVNSREVYR